MRYPKTIIGLLSNFQPISTSSKSPTLMDSMHKESSESQVSKNSGSGKDNVEAVVPATWEKASTGKSVRGSSWWLFGDRSVQSVKSLPLLTPSLE